jgi:hypothetical protein
MVLRTLYQTLLDSDPARLRVIAQQWAITLTANRRPDIAAELADAMTHVEAVERTYERLPESTRAALEDLLREANYGWHGGAIPWEIFTRRWGELRAVGPGRLEREALWQDPISETEALWYWGFLQRAFVDWQTGPVEMAFVPEELQLYLPVPPPRVLPPPDTTSPPGYEILGDDTLADDLVTLWAYLQSQRIHPSPEGLVPLQRRELLLQQFNIPAEPRLALLQRLALEQGWIHQDEHGLLRPVPKPTLDWLQSDAWTQWSSVAHAWMKSTQWNDLDIVFTLKSDPLVGWPGDSLKARRKLITMLQQCVPDTWYTIEDFVSYMREHATDFLRPDGDYNSKVPRDAHTDVPLRGFEAWDKVEGMLIRFILMGPLAWLGLVDLGKMASWLSPIAFRLDKAGAALLDLGPAPDFPPPPPVQLEYDGLLIVPRQRRYERFQLSRVAQCVARGKSYRYHLTPRSLNRARQQHIAVDRLVDFLEKTTGQHVPEELQDAIKRAYHGKAVANLQRSWILEVKDPELLTLPALQPRQGITPLGPRAMLIHTSERGKIIASLIAEGVLPEISQESKIKD